MKHWQLNEVWSLTWLRADTWGEVWNLEDILNVQGLRDCYCFSATKSGGYKWKWVLGTLAGMQKFNFRLEVSSLGVSATATEGVLIVCTTGWLMPGNKQHPHEVEMLKIHMNIVDKGRHEEWGLLVQIYPLKTVHRPPITSPQEGPEDDSFTKLLRNTFVWKLTASL